MDFGSTILIIIILILSILVVYTFIKNVRISNRLEDSEIKNILTDIEMKKRKIRDEVNATPLDRLIDERNKRGDEL